MSDCKPSGKSPTSDVNSTSISSIINTIQGLFDSFQTKARRIPPPLLLIGKKLRPGLSARNLAARTISRLESEAGLPMGDVFSDGPNREALKVKLMSEEMVSMIQTESKTQVLIDPGAIQILNADGSVGSNTLPIGADGFTF
tara:strand:+ start:6944 stop:7369 length:426 start_codon:yes stop_codon:yes gene_type:complete